MAEADGRCVCLLGVLLLPEFVLCGIEDPEASLFAVLPELDVVFEVTPAPLLGGGAAADGGRSSDDEDDDGCSEDEEAGADDDDAQ